MSEDVAIITDPPFTFFDEIEKIAFDLHKAIKDIQGEYIKRTIEVSIFVNKKWKILDEKTLYSNAFVNYMKNNFNQEPSIVEENQLVFIYSRISKHMT